MDRRQKRPEVEWLAGSQSEGAGSFGDIALSVSDTGSCVDDY